MYVDQGSRQNLQSIGYILFVSRNQVYFGVRGNIKSACCFTHI